MKKLFSLMLALMVITCAVGFAGAAGIDDWTIAAGTGDYTSRGLTLTGEASFSALYKNQVDISDFTFEFTLDKLGTYKEEGDHWFNFGLLSKEGINFFDGSAAGLMFLMRPGYDALVLEPYVLKAAGLGDLVAGEALVLPTDYKSPITFKIKKESGAYAVYFNDQKVNVDVGFLATQLPEGKAYFSAVSHDANTTNKCVMTVNFDVKAAPAAEVAAPAEAAAPASTPNSKTGAVGIIPFAIMAAASGIVLKSRQVKK